mgnify:CR=1 FL=1
MKCKSMRKESIHGSITIVQLIILQISLGHIMVGVPPSQFPETIMIGTDNGPNLFMPTERSPARNTYWRNANWLEDNYARRSPTPYQLTPNGNEPRYYYEGGRNRHHGSAQVISKLAMAS